MSAPPVVEEVAARRVKRQSLGKVQLRDQETNELILVPTPSNDPNDPLNWSNARKYWVFSLTCFGIFFAHAVIVGPSVALGLITLDFFPGGPESVAQNLSKTSYLQTGCSLMIGVANLIWVPLAVKYGRRPVYIASYSLLTACCIWSAVAKSFPSALVARLLLGAACGAPEIVAPLTITDLFFLHQRGRAMVIYTCALSAGVGIGVVFAGLITRVYSWRYVFWILGAFVFASTVLVIFTFPETQYRRKSAEQPQVSTTVSDTEKLTTQFVEDAKSSPGPEHEERKRRSFIQNLRIFSGTYTSESLSSMIFRPLFAVWLPAIFWACMISSVTVGMIVVVSANFSTAFSETYGFETWQIGLTYISTIIGSFIAIFLGGHFTDWVADKLTVRASGVRTPEHRLPAIVVSLITGPLACILYGVGFGKKLHWICPTIGIGLVNFTTVQSNNIALVYILDSYRPISGEVIVTQSVFKAIIGFLISFYVNPWVQKSGYINVFGTLAGVSAAVFLSTIPLYYFGHRVRQATFKWGISRRFLNWNADREVGE